MSILCLLYYNKHELKTAIMYRKINPLLINSQDVRK